MYHWFIFLNNINFEENQFFSWIHKLTQKSSLFVVSEEYFLQKSPNCSTLWGTKNYTHGFLNKQQWQFHKHKLLLRQNTKITRSMKYQLGKKSYATNVVLFKIRQVVNI